jgi:alkylation response protein AidB-like acyl-CoA dehydrogenase
MDLHDSPAEAAFRAEARAFLHAHPGEGKLDYFAEEVSTAELLAAAKRWQRTLYESGWAALDWPERYGGRGLGPVELIIWNQELGRAGVGESLFVVGIG